MDYGPPTTHRIAEFHKWNIEKRLVLKPPYQRKPVWSLRTKSYLIDTILSGLPVPEIYLQVKTDAKGNTTYDVVDGQQRIRSILEYIDGEYPVNEEESTDFGGKEFKDLENGNRQEFWDYQLVVRELITSHEEDVRAVFRRINKNVVPLNKQELRHSAYSGQFIKVVEELAEDDYWAENKIASPSDIRRMKDAEFVSELMIAIKEGVQERTETLDKYYEMYDDQFPDKEKWEKHFRKTQDTITEVLGDLRGTHWNSNADFYGLFVAVSDILEYHAYSPDDFPDLKECLLEFRRLVNVEKEQSKNKVRADYYTTIGFGGLGDKDLRAKRVEIIKRLMLPYVTSKDPNRNFTEEQRQLAWDTSKDKKCAICGKKVEWTDYSLDHKVSYAKGGRTILSNSQITHKKCNASKSNKA